MTGSQEKPKKNGKRGYLKMNRPNKEDYGTWKKCPEGWERRLHSIDYQLDLEKYCDELEKALDKVCELLEDCPLSTLDKELDCNNCTDDYAKCWKEWLLKDD